jgi:hypothetical protein
MAQEELAPPDPVELHSTVSRLRNQRYIMAKNSVRNQKWASSG